MPTLTIDGKEITVEKGYTVLQACEQAGVEIPRFCYHERLEIAGNCRMCLVEMERSPKPVASCAMPAGDGMVIKTNSEQVKKAREGVMEFLLINHPLDCPICDQGGECDLQDQAMAYGKGDSRFKENKRAVKDKYMGPLIKTHMTRCIHCTRCVRFADDIAGVQMLGAVNRGEHTEITTYLEQALDSEMSANVIDLCPVGALTSRPYAFKSRPWELDKTETIDVLDAVGSNIRVDSKGREVLRVLPRLNEDVNEEWISDKTRYACDALKVQRIDKPYIKLAGKLQQCDWDKALNNVAENFNKLDPSEIAVIIGDQVEVETIYSLKKLMNSLDVQSLECRQDGSSLSGEDISSCLYNTTIAGTDEADVILLIGTNPRVEAPIINSRIRKAYLNGAKIFCIGKTFKSNYPIEFLGESLETLEQASLNKGKLFEKLDKAKKGMVILGNNVTCHDEGSSITELAKTLLKNTNNITKDWNGFNMLHTAASRVGGLLLGFTQKDKTISDIYKKVEDKTIKLVYLIGADELDTKRLENAKVIYQGHHGDAGVKIADIILPGSAYTEKDGIIINTEGRVQYLQKAVDAPNEAIEDWKIIRALSERLNKTLPFNDINELREALFNEFPDLESRGEIINSDWKESKNKVDLSKGIKLDLAINNFYMTCPISRNSSTMAKCVDEILDNKRAA